MKNIIFMFLILISFEKAFSQDQMPSEDMPPEIPAVDFTQIDPIVPQPQLMQALKYLDDHTDDFPNQNYLVLIDYGKVSSKKRFYLINLKTGAVESRLVAHGKGSDLNNDGIADSFSNTEDSKMTSLGFYRTENTYTGDNGYSLRLTGLSATNSNAMARAIVMHGAPYVDEEVPRAGRSWGCPALDLRQSKRIINLIKGGSLIFSFRTKPESAD